MRGRATRGGVALAAALGVMLGASRAQAHEPSHSIGPNTLWKGGTAVEFHVEGIWADDLWHGSHRERDPGRGRDREADFSMYVAHGLTADFGIFIDAPLRWGLESRGGATERAFGAGDVLIGGKYRFVRNQKTARSDQAAVFAALNLPTARTTTHPPLGSGRAQAILGTAFARDALYLYLWGNVRIAAPIPGGRKLAPWEFGTNFALGTRFWEPQVGEGADLVLLFETSYRASTPSVTRGHTDPNTGLQRWTAGPGFLLFWDQYEVQGGVQIPIWRRARGRQYVADAEVVLGVGILF